MLYRFGFSTEIILLGFDKNMKPLCMCFFRTGVVGTYICTYCIKKYCICIFEKSTFGAYEYELKDFRQTSLDLYRF